MSYGEIRDGDDDVIACGNHAREMSGFNNWAWSVCDVSVRAMLLIFFRGLQLTSGRTTPPYGLPELLYFIPKLTA